MHLPQLDFNEEDIELSIGIAAPAVGPYCIAK
jgi:hypothetical protein